MKNEDFTGQYLSNCGKTGTIIADDSQKPRYYLRLARVFGLGQNSLGRRREENQALSFYNFSVSIISLWKMSLVNTFIKMETDNKPTLHWGCDEAQNACVRGGSGAGDQAVGLGGASSTETSPLFLLCVSPLRSSFKEGTKL